jgi:hypothetical protein
MFVASRRSNVRMLAGANGRNWPSAARGSCTRCRGVLAWRYGRGVPDQGDELTLALDLQPQDAEAAIGVVERDALDQSREAFRFWPGRGVGGAC